MQGGRCVKNALVETGVDVKDGETQSCTVCKGEAALKGEKRHAEMCAGRGRETRSRRICKCARTVDEVERTARMVSTEVRSIVSDVSVGTTGIVGDNNHESDTGERWMANSTFVKDRFLSR